MKKVLLLFLLLSTASAASLSPNSGVNIQDLPSDVLSFIGEYNQESLSLLGRTNRIFRGLMNQKWALSQELSRSLNIPSLEFVPLSEDFQVLRGISLPDTPENRIKRLDLLLSSAFKMTTPLKSVIFTELANLLRDNEEVFHAYINSSKVVFKNGSEFLTDFMNYLIKIRHFDDALALKDEFEFGFCLPELFKYQPELLDHLHQNPSLFKRFFSKLTPISSRVLLETNVSIASFIRRLPQELVKNILALLAEPDYQIANNPHVVSRLNHICDVLTGSKYVNIDVLKWAVRVHLGTEQSFLDIHHDYEEIAAILVKFGHFNTILNAEPSRSTSLQLLSMASKYVKLGQGKVFQQYKSEYEALMVELNRVYKDSDSSPRFTPQKLDEIVASFNYSENFLKKYSYVGQYGSLEQILKTIRQNPAHRVQGIIFSGILRRCHEDISPILKRVYPLLDPEIFSSTNFKYFYSDHEQFFRLLQDAEFVSMIKSSPIKFKIGQALLHDMLNDEKLFAEALKYPSASISEFIGSLHDNGTTPERVSVELMRRFLKLKEPNQVIPALCHEMQVLADSWDKIHNAELIGSGYVQLWSEFDPESLDAVVADDGRDLSHIQMPFSEQFGEHFTEERWALTRKLALLVDHFQNSKL